MTEEPTPAPSLPARNRRRRSRQCRGNRARNYQRAFARAEAGKDYTQTSIILAEAEYTGAKSEQDRWQRERQEEEAAKT